MQFVPEHRKHQTEEVRIDINQQKTVLLPLPKLEVKTEEVKLPQFLKPNDSVKQSTRKKKKKSKKKKGKKKNANKKDSMLDSLDNQPSNVKTL